VTRLLGADLGTRRIGLAVGDTVNGAVLPLTTIRRADIERDAATIATLIAEQRVDELVVGYPLNMDGSAGPHANATKDWAQAVAAMCGVPLTMRDERLTTEDAIARVGGQSRGRSGGPPSAQARRSYRARLDRLAAAAIVQAELDARAAVAQTVDVQGDP
jgi:putative Holliday junction resolvase